MLLHDRKVVRIRNEYISVAVTAEGGHVAELSHLASGISPLWIPHWKSIEPSVYSPATHPEFGTHQESRLLSGLVGHSLCLDVFGDPGPNEHSAGIPVHGEAPIAQYDIRTAGDCMHMSTHLPKSQLSFARSIRLAENGVVHFSEIVKNETCFDRPIAWTQHVTIGAPFLEKGATRFLLSARRSKVYEGQFNSDIGMQLAGAEFTWPHCPLRNGASEDLSRFTSEPVSGGFSTHQMKPEDCHAFFVAWSPTHRLAFGYVWHTSDFPWLARWEENHLRAFAPWNSKGFALGMEFGVSPMVESRRAMVQRSPLFGTPTFLWLPAKTAVSASYCAFVRSATELPHIVRWDGSTNVELILAR